MREMFYVHGLNPVEGNVTAAFKVIQHVLRSASNKDHTVAYAQYILWRDNTEVWALLHDVR